MELSRHNDIEKDFRNLRRFPTPQESLEAWERLFCLKGIKETPGIDLFPGFGGLKIYKGRVIPLRENIGKSKGYRVIFQLIKGESYKILVFSRHGIYHNEYDLIRMVKDRL
ncbi:MAG: hypothetical protein Q8Q95_00285 [bacterium]|nr:hypothetical protein [bacterium]